MFTGLVSSLSIKGRHMFEFDIGNGSNDSFVCCISKLYRDDIELNLLEYVWNDGE